MAFSTQRVTSDGSLVLLDLSIDYFFRSEITVFFDGVVAAEGDGWDWVGSTEKKISFSPAVPNGVEVLIQRRTTLDAPLHEFLLGAAFTAKSVDENSNQLIRIAQEAVEGSTLAEVFNDLDMHGFKVVNVGTGTNPGDAVNFSQLSVHDNTIIGYRDQAAGSALAASNSAAAALNSQNVASGSAIAAGNSAAAALNSQNAASGSASAASVSASNALDSANTASGSAADALGYRNTTLAYRNEAEGFRNQAAISAGNALVSEQNAAASATQTVAPNLIINGGFDFWQRGVSLGTTVGLRYLADRWLCASGGNSTFTASRQSFVAGTVSPTGNPAYYHRLSTTAGAAASGNFVLLRHHVEGVRTGAAGPVTLTFWARSTSTVPIAVEFGQNFGVGGSADVYGIGVTQCTCTTAWQLFTVTATLPSLTTKTVGSSSSLYVSFWTSAGSSFNSRTGSLGERSSTVDIAQVKLEYGVAGTAFVRPDYELEYARCRRFYERNPDCVGQTYPGAPPAPAIRMHNHFAASQPYDASVFFSTPKRIVPVSRGRLDIGDGADADAVVVAAGRHRILFEASVPPGSFWDINDWEADAEFY